MFAFFMGNSLWYLVQQSDFLSKLVLLLLFTMSITCWTVFIGKLLLFRARNRDIKRVHDMLRTIRSLDDLVTVSAHLSGTVAGELITQTISVVRMLLEKQPTQTARNAEIVQYHIDQMVETLVTNEESYLPLLATSAAVAPLIGLFGTVWGLIHAFIRISEKQTADITVVAPGIAEALITTLAGLIIAIPALIMYNYLIAKVRRIEHRIVHLADRISFIMQQTLVG